MSDPETPHKRAEPPILASPARRLLHTLIALAGWVLFVWWWWIVVRSVHAQAVRFTVIFVLVTTAVVVLITAVWAIHNRLIFKRRGPRTQVRPVAEEFTRDRLGRGVHFAGGLEAIRGERIVQVRLEHQGKVYRGIRQVPGRVPNGVPTGEGVSNHDRG